MVAYRYCLTLVRIVLHRCFRVPDLERDLENFFIPRRNCPVGGELDARFEDVALLLGCSLHFLRVCWGGEEAWAG